MLIFGVQKTTLIDFPGKVACIVFTAGCNLRCQYCHNSELVLPEKIQASKERIPQEVFFNFLQTKQGILDGVSICGGEPTLQKDLEAFCRRIKAMGFLVKLDTNGQSPEVLEKLLQKRLVDYIAMDIKCDYSHPKHLLGVNIQKEKYLQSIQIIKSSLVEYEFRTTLIKNYHTLKDFPALLEPIVGAKKYFLQNYKGGNTLQKDFPGTSFTHKELVDFKNIAIQYIVDTTIRI